MNVLPMIYCCIFIDVVVMNDCMSIIKNVLFYYIECNCDECITNDLLLYFYWM